MPVKKIKIRFTVNGTLHEIGTFPMARLLDVLRSGLNLMGTKEGCGEGECGACAVFINGELVNSCLIPVIQVKDCHVRTIEGLARGDFLHQVQQAFLEHGGAQCGICTPGMIMAAVHLVENNPNPSDDKIRDALVGNLCRCTGYIRIFESIVRACEKMRESGTGSFPSERCYTHIPI